MDNLSEKHKINFHRKPGIVNKDQHKEHRLSKESIGQPMQMEKNGRLATISKSMNNLASPSMMMKLIIVHPDDKGYGLTLNEDTPNIVQSLKKDGPAALAGLAQGDKILKINNVSVSNLNYNEMVKLIKEQSYATFTLLRSHSTLPEASLGAVGKSESLSTIASPMSQQTTVYEEKVETIKKMLIRENAEVERIKEEYGRNPAEKLLKELSSAQKLKQDLEKQLWKAKSKQEKLEQHQTASSQHDVMFASAETSKKPAAHNEKEELETDLSHRPSQTGFPSRLRREPSTDASGVESPQDPSSTMVVSKNDNTMTEEINVAIRRGSGGADLDVGQVKMHNSLSKRIMSFEDDSDGDGAAQDNASSMDHGPFSRFDVLRQRPAHLAVFFNYVIDSREPGNFLLYMAVEGYKQLNNAKEHVKVGDSICQTYLSADAICPVPVDSGMVKSIEAVIHSKNIAEETLKTIFDPAVQVALKEVRQQLADYCATREKGMSGLYGEDRLLQALHSEQSSDAKIVDDILTPTFNKLQKITAVEEAEQSRINLKLDALQTFMSQYGSKKAKKNFKIYSKIRPKTIPMAKTSRMSGSMDSIIDDPKDKRLSGIGGIFGGKKNEKLRVKSEKPKSHHDRSIRASKRSKASRRHTIRDVPPVFVAEPLRSSKLTASLSSDPSLIVSSSGGGVGTGLFDARGLGRLAERAEANLRSIQHERPKSAQFAENTKIGDSAQVYQTSSSDLNSSQYRCEDQQVGVDGDTLNVGSHVDALNRSGSFGTSRTDLKRTVVPTKSRSDPETDQVEQAIHQHNTARFDQSEVPSRPHALYPPESFPSIFPEAKLMELFTSVNKDSEIDIDDREQHWTDMVPKSVKKHMDKKEIERQEIITELITTEQHHVRDLKILEKLFYEPFIDFRLLSHDEIVQVFPNLQRILQLHRDFNAVLQKKKNEQQVVDKLGDIVLAMFDGEGGNDFKNQCALYCGNQSTVLGFIKEKSRKDPAFHQFLENAYKHPVCRRLNLKDFVPMEFQRLTKYPLLLQNILKHTTKKDEDEKEKLSTACQQCRQILCFVNQSIKEAEDRQLILEIERNLDREPMLKLKNTDVIVEKYTKRRLDEKPVIHQGTLTWRIAGEKRKLISLHCILYDDIMLLLQKQEDRYILRCQELHAKSYNPFIYMNGVHVRNVATDKRAFFVVSYQSALMYEFVCSTASAMKEWVEVISRTSKNVPPTPSFIKRSDAISSPVVNIEDEKSDENLPAGQLVGRAEYNEPPFPPEESSEDLSSSFYSSSVPLSSESSSLLRNRVLLKNKEIIELLTSKYELFATMSNLPVSELEAMLDMCMSDHDPDPVTLVRHAAVCIHKLVCLINSACTPDNTYAKSKSETNSKRFSMVDQPSPFQADVSSPAEPDQWAARAPHSGEKSYLFEPSSSLNTVSDLPFSESDAITSPGLNESGTRFSQLSATETLPSDASQSSGDAIKQTGSSPVRTCPLSDEQQRSKSHLALSDPPHSQPSSGFDLCVTSRDAPFKKMVEAALMLQAQLTRLVHINQKMDREKALLLAANQQLREELAGTPADMTQDSTAEEEPPPPYFEE